MNKLNINTDISEIIEKEFKDCSVYYEDENGQIVEAFGYKEITKVID